jgi:hypothetical protein
MRNGRRRSPCLSAQLALDPRPVNSRSLLASTLTDRALSGLTTWLLLTLRVQSGWPHRPRTGRLAARSRISSIVSDACAGGPEEAIPEYAFNRNFVLELFGLGLCKLHVGSIEEVISRGGAIHSRQPPRSSYRLFVFPDQECASAAVAHRRGDRVVRESAQDRCCCTGLFAAVSLLPTPSEGRPNAPPRNSPKTRG